MAEEEIDDEIKIEEGRQSSQKPKAYGGYINRRCNTRLEELAKPKKWLMLATWREHRYIFDPERMNALKEKIQEEFSMTPEETEVYFNQLRKHARRILNKKALAKQIRREKALARQEAYRIFKRILMKAMRYSFLNPPPPIVSPVMRETSNKILKLLCEIHNVDIPKRDKNDKKSIFLLNLADWSAILISNIYYEVNVNEKVETERLKQYSKTSVKPSEISQAEGDEEDEEISQATDVKSEPETGSYEDSKVVSKTESTKPGDDTTAQDESAEPSEPVVLDDTAAEDDFEFEE